MKRTAITTCLAPIFLILFFIAPATAQVSFGIKAGVAPTIDPKTNYTIANRAYPVDEFIFNIVDVQNGFYLGAFAEFDLDASFFMRGELLYNRQQSDYSVQYTGETLPRDLREQTYTEVRQRIDLPLSIGARIGSIDVSTGLVPRIIVKNDNEMSVMEGYSESLDAFQLGFQSGIAVNFQGLQLGMTYQMDFNNYGSHITYRGESLDLQNRPSRFIFSLGYRF